MGSNPITFGSLFTGIGGLDLGLERAGMVCKWQVEIDDYATRVLERHWPRTPRWRDIRSFANNGEQVPCVDLIAGGFPCQDISDAGKRVGIEGERSGLWSEFCRVIRKLRPQLVLVENVPALLRRGMGRVLGDLAESGLNAEWQCIPASAFGAHYRGDRLFIVASSSATSCLRRKGCWTNPLGTNQWGEHEFARLVQVSIKHGVPAGSTGGISDGVSNRVHKLRGLGNSVVPQVAEWIGRQIVANSEDE